MVSAKGLKGGALLVLPGKGRVPGVVSPTGICREAECFPGGSGGLRVVPGVHRVPEAGELSQSRLTMGVTGVPGRRSQRVFPINRDPQGFAEREQG
jgi:hypothetical protein